MDEFDFMFSGFRVLLILWPYGLVVAFTQVVWNLNQILPSLTTPATTIREPTPARTLDSLSLDRKALFQGTVRKANSFGLYHPTYLSSPA